MRSVRDDLPGSELVAAGLADLAAGRQTVEALLASLAASRLRALGFTVTNPVPDADHRLWETLATEDPDAAHGRYNALVRRLVSFERAAGCVA
ncbi:MAG: hypothetical protein ACRD0N_05955 [Acidimicrobiales bacterium]